METVEQKAAEMEVAGTEAPKKKRASKPKRIDGHEVGCPAIQAWDIPDACSCDYRAPKVKKPKVEKPLNPCFGAERHEVAVPTVHYGLRMDFTPSNVSLQRYCEHFGYKPKTRYDEEAGYSRPTFDEGGLLHLLTKYPADRLFPLISRYRQVEKCKGTYVDGLDLRPSDVGTDYAVVYGEFLHVPSTGRLCVAAGTPIEIVRDVAAQPRGIPIEDVEIGSLAYSFDANRKLVLRKVLNKWKTGHKQVVRIHWQGDGRQHDGYLDVTPEHRVRLVSSDYVEAQTLKEGDRILSLSRGITDYGYARMWATGHDEIPREHRFVWEQLVGGTLPEHIHHINHNKLDNRPENLKGMTASNHHSEHGDEHWTKDRREWRKQENSERWGRGPVRRNELGKRPAWLGITKEWMLDVLYENGGDSTAFTRLYGIERKYVKKHLDKKKIRVTDIQRECKSTKNHRVTSVEWLPNPVDVWDLEIEETHNFIAGELCVHNSMKGAPHQLQPKTSDPENPFYQVRDMYVARPGWRLLARDFSGIEAKIVAYVAGVNLDGTEKPGREDARHMLRLTEIDVHGYLASHAIGQPADLAWSNADLADYFGTMKKENRRWDVNGVPQLYKDVREACKTGLYASLYGGKPGTMVRSNPQIFTNDTVATFYQEQIIFSAFPCIRKWHWDVYREVEKQWYIASGDGYRQHYCDVLEWKFSKTEQKWNQHVGKAADQAVNAVPQHLGMCFTGQGIDLFWENYPELRHGLRLTIHDEILGEWPEHEVLAASEALRVSMETPLNFLPLPASWGLGSHLSVGTEAKCSPIGGSWKSMNPKYMEELQ